MKNLKNKIRTKSFWMSVVAGVILILQTLGVKVDVPYVNEIVGSICSLLVLIGVFTAPNDLKTDVNTEELPQSDTKDLTVSETENIEQKTE